MNGKHSLVKAWLEKAERDLTAARGLMGLKPHPLPDAACFHAQQSAEKFLKAFLIYHDLPLQKTHDLGELIGVASKVDETFLELMDLGEKLTDYAVEVRYPLPGEEPTEEEAQEAIWMAEQIRTFVRRRLPF